MTSALSSPLDRPLTHHPSRLADLARRYAADPDSWPMAPRFDPSERWYGRIATEPDHEAWLLTWLPSQGTELHDHGGSAGAFTVVRGEITEQTVTPSGISTYRGYGAGPAKVPSPGRDASRESAPSVRGFGPRHVHRITNLGDAPAVSIHVYAPAITTMTEYQVDDTGLRPIETRRAGEDW
jgi:hypothetical protein